ncbi:MAG: hypothetical protein FNT15_02000 [Sulfurovum sp.]|nr:MAG: hypothetical protein FNT15_02000 [Sulfurovum sp.]
MALITIRIAQIILRIFVYSILFVYLVIIGFYIKGVKSSNIQNIPVSSDIYQDNIYNSYLMVSSDENASKNIKNMEMRAISIVFDLPLAFIKDGHYYTIASREETNIAYYIAKHVLQDFELKKSQSDLLFTTIWISNHWTLKESLNYLLDRFDYGNGYYGLKSASKGYFNKTPNELNPYEVLILQSIGQAPNELNPKKNQQALLDSVNLLIERAKENYPQRFASLHFLNQLPPMQGIVNTIMIDSNINMSESNTTLELNNTEKIVTPKVEKKVQEVKIRDRHPHQEHTNNTAEVYPKVEHNDESPLPEAQIMKDESKVQESNLSQ